LETVTEPIVLVVLGGLLALDGTSMGQFMVSRPLVAGTLTGWVLGDPFLGLLVGGIIELYFIPVFPVGGADFPEGGPPTVVAVVAASGMPGAGGIALGVMMGLVWSRLAAFSNHLLRRTNGKIVPDPARAPVSAGPLVRAHLTCLSLDFCRGGLLTVLGILAARPAGRALDGIWPLSPPFTLGFLILGAALPAGAFVRSLGGWRKRGVLFAAGAGGFLIGSILL
jgi:mannose/fructose/N-acetylgalactosamine-specific phosphotransferase system component IIC